MAHPMREDSRPHTATRSRFVGPPGLRAPPEEDDVSLIGRYEVLETLGSGAMGIVYKARDPLLDRIVAVKTIVPPKDNGRRDLRAYLERFEREAKAAAQMQHPGIVTIFDVGSHNGAPFMVLEFLPGDSLADRLDRVRLPLARAVQTAIDLANALGFAHDQQIVHRDVKPANVLYAGNNRWKLADFGIARVPNSELTQVGIFMGTPGYAPPEAVSDGLYTAQADVFAWGAVLYELLSGRIPYEGPDTRTTNRFVLEGKAPSPRQHDASIPVVLSEVCMTALHPSPATRYRDANEAQKALEEAWERCLNEDELGPRAFSTKEIPHEQAPALMHTGPPLQESVVTNLPSTPAIPKPKLVPVMPQKPELATKDKEDNEKVFPVPNTPIASKPPQDLVVENVVHSPTLGIWASFALAILFTAGLGAYYLLNS